MSKVTSFEILNHGMKHAQYFHELYHSDKFRYAVTGKAKNAKEAYNDAMEQISSDCTRLPTNPRGVRASDCIDDPSHKGEDSEFYYYISIRYNLDVG